MADAMATTLERGYYWVSVAGGAAVHLSIGGNAHDIYRLDITLNTELTLADASKAEVWLGGEVIYVAESEDA